PTEAYSAYTTLFRSNQTIAELSTLVVTNTATDADVPANTLTFSLVSGPAGVSVNPTTGVLTWSPTEAQGPSTNVITVKVTDNGAPALSDSQSFTVVVTEANSAPVLTVPGSQNIAELSTLVVTNTATDADVPANTLTFRSEERRVGKSVNATTGVLTWTKTEDEVPSTNGITVMARVQAFALLSYSQSFTVVVTEANSAPVLTAPANQAIVELSTLVVTNTATDADVPANTLTF